MTVVWKCMITARKDSDYLCMKKLLRYQSMQLSTLITPCLTYVNTFTTLNDRMESPSGIWLRHTLHPLYSSVDLYQKRLWILLSHCHENRFPWSHSIVWVRGRKPLTSSPLLVNWNHFANVSYLFCAFHAEHNFKPHKFVTYVFVHV